MCVNALDARAIAVGVASLLSTGSHGFSIKKSVQAVGYHSTRVVVSTTVRALNQLLFPTPPGGLGFMVYAAVNTTAIMAGNGAAARYWCKPDGPGEQKDTQVAKLLEALNSPAVLAEATALTIVSFTPVLPSQCRVCGGDKANLCDGSPHFGALVHPCARCGISYTLGFQPSRQD